MKYIYAKGKFARLFFLCWLLTLSPLMIHAQTASLWEGPFNREPFVEASPSLSADGNKMVFTAYRNSDPELRQLFECNRKDNGSWSDPFPISSVNNLAEKGSQLGGCFLSADGNRLYFHAQLNDSRGSTDLYYVQRKGYGWGEPVNLGDTINTDGTEKYPSLAQNGTELYFQRTAIPEKIYFPQNPKILLSQKIKGKWSNPIWLPPPLNQRAAYAPSILPDGITLVYAAETDERAYRLAYFITQWQDGEWLEPERLIIPGPDMEEGVAVSTSATMDSLVFANRQGISIAPLAASVSPAPMKLGRIEVRDYITLEAVDSKVTVYSRSGKHYPFSTSVNPDDGQLLALLPAEDEYDVEVIEDGYAPVYQPLQLSQIVPADNDLALLPESVEVVINLSDLITDEELQADLLLTDSLSRSVDIQYDSTSMQYTANLKMKESYQLQVNAENYQQLSRTIKIDSLTNLQAVSYPLKLKRNFYDFSFRVTDAIYGFVPEDVNFSVLNLKSQMALYPVYDAEKQSFMVELDDDTRYKVEVEAYGYEKYVSEINAGQLINSQEFRQQIGLTKEGQ